MNFSFCNRTRETRYLAKVSDEAISSEAFSLIIVHGMEGVGKSTLIQKTIEEYIGKDVIRCEVSFNPFRKYESGAFLRSIAHEIDASLRHCGSSHVLEKFILKEYGTSSATSVLVAGGIDVAKRIPGLSGILKEASKSTSKATHLYRLICAQSAGEQADIFWKYIAFASRDTKVCVHIKNFQVIDETTLSVFEDFQSSFRNLVIIAEWVTYPGDDLSQNEIHKRVCYAIPSRRELEVKALPIEELYDQIASNPKAVFSLIAKSYGRESGNLKDLERILNEYSYKQSAVSISELNDTKLRNMARGQLVLLSIIALSDGAIEVDLLDNVIATARDDALGVGELIKREVQTQYIIQNGNLLVLDHDSTMRRVLSDSSLMYEREYAATLLLHYFRTECFAENDVPISMLLNVVRLSLVCRDIHATSLYLKKIDSMIAHGNSIEEAASVVSDYLISHCNSQSFNMSLWEQISKCLVPILLKHNLLSKSTCVTEVLAEKGIYWKFVHIIALLSALNIVGARHWIETVDTILHCANEAEERQLSSFLLVLKIWMCRLQGDINRASELYHSIDTEHLADPIQRAIIYRYAEIADVKESEQCLNKALDLASKSNDVRMVNQIKMALAQEYAFTGDIKRAKSTVLEVPEDQCLTYFEKYCKENNTIACNNMLGIPSDVDYIEMLSHSTTDHFDRIILENNMLLASTISKNHEKIRTRSNRIIFLIETLNHIEPNIKKISCLNISYAHYIVGDLSMSAKWWRKHMSIQTDVDREYWKLVESYPTMEDYFTERLCPYYPPFMTDWFVLPDAFLSPS